MKTNGVVKVKAGGEKATVLDGEVEANGEPWPGGAIDEPGARAVAARGGTRGAEVHGVVDVGTNANVGNVGSIVNDVGSGALLAESLLAWLMCEDWCILLSCYSACARGGDAVCRGKQKKLTALTSTPHPHPAAPGRMSLHIERIH